MELDNIQLVEVLEEVQEVVVEQLEVVVEVDMQVVVEVVQVGPHLLLREEPPILVVMGD